MEAPLAYPLHDWTGTVTHCGRICYKSRKVNLSQVFAGQDVGVKQVDDHLWLVTFMEYDLGYFDDETCRLEPITNPFGPKVLPLSPEKTPPMQPEWTRKKLEAPPGFEPGMEVLQTSALPLGDGAGRTRCFGAGESGRVLEGATTARARAGEGHHVRMRCGP